MKFANWALVYSNDHNNEALDKAAQQVIGLTDPTHDSDSCSDNIKREKDLIFLSVESITKQIQIFHHVTLIGGTISSPDILFVGLSGFSSDCNAIQLHPDILGMTDKVKVPAWAAITRLSSRKEVKDQKAAANGPNMGFRRLIAIPPFLHKSIISATSRDPGNLLIDCMAAITVFDNTHKDGDDFPDGMDACKHLLYFLWAATHNKIEETICVHIS